MTGPEHYREAERLLDLTFDRYDTIEERAEVAARAQAHATLALAAATWQGSQIAGGFGVDSELAQPWQEATS